MHIQHSKRFLTQLHFKIVSLISVLLIASFLFMNFFAVDRLEYVLVTSLVILVIGILSYFGYRNDFFEYDREIASEINDNMAFKSILHSIPVAMLITDGERIDYHNKEVRTLFRKSYRMIETSYLKDLLSKEYAIMFANELKHGGGSGSMIVRINNKIEVRGESVCMMSWEPVYYNKKDQYFISFVDITDIHKDRYNAIKLNSIYENIMNKLPYSIAIFEDDGNMYFMNQEFKSNIGNVLNTDFSSLIEFNVNKNLLNTGFQIALTGDTYRTERITAVDGGIAKWGDIIMTSVQTDDENNYVGYIVNDISDYKQKISYLEKQNNSFISGYEKNIIAMASWNTDGTLFKGNKEFYKILQIEEDRVLNLFYDSFYDILDFDEVIFLKDYSSTETKKFYGNTLRIGKKIFIESIKSFRELNLYIRISDKNPIKQYLSQINATGEVWLMLNTYPLYTTDDSLDSFIINITDISEHFDLTKRFEITDTYLKSISNNFEAGIILIVDAKENIVFIGGNQEIAKKINSFKKHLHKNNTFPLSDVEELSKLSKNIIATLNGHNSKLNTIFYGEQYSFIFNAVRNSKAEIDYCLVFGLNVSERENYEKQLLFQKYLLDKTFTESQIPQVIVNANGLINRANLEYYKVANITHDDLYELSIYDKNCWLNKPEIIKNFELALEGKSSEFEVVENRQFNILKEGNKNDDWLYIFNCSSYPIIDSNNIVSNVIFNFIDVSESRILIEKMRESNAINDIVTENYPGGLLIVLDTNNKVLLFSGNEEMEELELDKNKILNNTLDNLEGSIFNAIKPYIEKVKEKKRTSNFDFSIEITPENRFPITIYYEADIIPILDFHSNVERIFVCLNNITNRKQLEETILEFNTKLENEVAVRTTQLKETAYDLEVYIAELQETQKKLIEAQRELKESLDKEQELNQIKSEFISLMSHEFRTPLTVIQTTIYLLESYYEMGLTEKIEKGSKRILNEIDAMTKLLDNILFLDELKDQSAVFSNLEMVSFITDIVNEIKNYAMPKHNIVFKSEKEEVIMLSDPKLIKPIVKNLLLNAINYSPDTKPINITLLDSEEQFIFVIQDFGNGISDDVIDNLFDTFVRSRDFTNISGVGLGLSITKNCVELLKGNIKFDTEKGQGTTFYVAFPKLSLPAPNNLIDDDEVLISDTGTISPM